MQSFMMAVAGVVAGLAVLGLVDLAIKGVWRTICR